MFILRGFSFSVVKSARVCYKWMLCRQSSTKLSIITPGRVDGVPHYDVEVTDENFDSMTQVLIKQVRPYWDVNHLQCKNFTGGLVNKVIGYFSVENTNSPEFRNYNRSEIVLIRIYGKKTELTIKRTTKELRNILELSKHNIASPLYCTFRNGCCYRFIEGKVCTPKDFTNEDILRQSAICMAEIHNVKLSQEYLRHYKLQSSVFETLTNYLDAIPLRYHDDELQTRFENDVPFVEELRAEATSLSERISKVDNVVVTYCHNDLHPTNLILNETEGKLLCIDHEFGGINYSAFDIANHFNEFCGIFNIDYSLYPCKNTQLWWLKIYVEKLRELEGRTTRVTEEEVEELYSLVQLMSLLSHLLWGSWSLVPAHYTDDKFDYFGYGILRFNEYFRRKKEVLTG